MIAAGAEHTVAVTEDGDLYGWGWGRYGNLGLGDRDDRFVPEKVSPVEVGNLGPVSSEDFHMFIKTLSLTTGRKDGACCMWVAPLGYCVVLWWPLHLRLEQVWPARAWRFPRPPSSTQGGSSERKFHFSGTNAEY
jgi:hypothetical protein